MKRSGLSASLLVVLAASVSACGSPDDAFSAPDSISSTVNLPATSSTIDTRPAAKSLRTMFAGDILIHSQVWTAAEKFAGGRGYDFRPMWEGVKTLISSVDLAICHLEVPIAPPGKEPTTFPFYGAPRELVTAIKWAGWDRCSTASNHTFDKGVRGIEATLAAFDEEGLTQAGMARTPREIEPKIIEINGVKVTHLSYTFGYNGLQPPKGEEWRSALTESYRIIDDAKTARKMGAEVVIVSMHWGTEPKSLITNRQRTLAEKITESGDVDLIVGHHSHVLQPIEKVNGVWVVFGLGNHLSAHPTREFFPPASQDGALVGVEFSVTETGVTVSKPVVYPTWVDKADGYRIKDVLTNLAFLTSSRRDLEASLERTRNMVGDFLASAPAP